MPWTAVSKEPDRYFVKGSLPDGVDIVEPTKLRADDVAALWNHWRESQKTNERPVIFIEALPKDIRGHSDDVRWPRRKVKSKVGAKKGKGKGKAKRIESDESSSESSSDNKAEGKGNSRRKREYVELDDDPSSREEFEGYNDSSEDDDDDDKGEQGVEDIKWGPPSGPKGRPAIHLHTQLGEPGGSGLSDAAKERMARSTSANFWRAGGDGWKPKITLGTVLRDDDDDEAWMRKRYRSYGRNAFNDVEMAPPDRPEPADTRVHGILASADIQSDILPPADIHPGSPAACKATAQDRFDYLKRLSGNTHYSKLLDMIIGIEEVCFG